MSDWGNQYQINRGDQGYPSSYNMTGTPIQYTTFAVQTNFPNVPFYLFTLSYNFNTYKVCPEGTQPCNWKNRDIYWSTYKIQETLYIGYDATVPFKVGTLGPHTILPIIISCPVIYSWISSMVWNLFPFKGDFSFGKSQKSQNTKSEL